MQRWTKWLHTTKAITRISAAIFHTKRPFGSSVPLCVWISHAYCRTPWKATRQSLYFFFFFAAIKNGYIFFYYFLALCFLFLLFFQPNQRVLKKKTVLENISGCHQFFAWQNERGKQKDGHVGCSFAPERKSLLLGWNDRLSGTLWMIFYLYFLLCGDIRLFLGMLSGVGCILSGLHTSGSIPALRLRGWAAHVFRSWESEALQKLFFGGNDFVTCSLCVKSHVKYSVFWMELCFSSKLLLTVTVCFGWNLNGTYTVRGRCFWKMKKKKQTKTQGWKKKITKLLAM